MSRLKRLLQRVGLLAAVLVFCLLVAELAVRLLYPQNLILIRPDVWIPHDRYGWATAANLDLPLSFGESTIRFRTDAAGHRIGAVRPPEAPDVRILAVGDSFTQAVEVDYEDTLGAVLERELAVESGRSVRVVNAGVGGWNPNHYRLKVEDELARTHYDAVLVLFYLGNDVVKRPTDSFDPRAPTVRHAFRIPREASARELVDALLYPINDTLEESSHLFALIRDRALLLRMRFGLTSIQMPAVLDRRMQSSPRWNLAGELCAAIEEVAAQKGVPVLFALLPSIHEVDQAFVDEYVRFLGLEPTRYDRDQPSRMVSSRLRARGLSFVDTTAALRDAHAAGGDRLYDRVTVHFSPRGHLVAATAIRPELQRAVR